MSSNYDHSTNAATKKPAVQRFLQLFREGVKPRQLPLPSGKHRGRLIADLDDRELSCITEGYRGCRWLDVVEVLEVEWHRRQLRNSRTR
jgi:hypothetical protein